jgi:ArsR family transcriptional regulator
MSKQLPVVALDGCCSPLATAPLSEEQAEQLSGVFKALSDPVRLRVLSLIASHAGGEVCVCDITEAFDLTGPTISYHLKLLRQAGLITGERRGTWVYYRVHPEVLSRLSAVLVAPGAAVPATVAAH